MRACVPVRLASDARKNDGHKYRSYLCFMTCSGGSGATPRSRRRQNPEAKLQLSTGQILTDVLAQWIRRWSSLLPLPRVDGTSEIVSDRDSRDSLDNPSHRPPLRDLVDLVTRDGRKGERFGDSPFFENSSVFLVQQLSNSGKFKNFSKSFKL